MSSELATIDLISKLMSFICMFMCVYVCLCAFMCVYLCLSITVLTVSTSGQIQLPKRYLESDRINIQPKVFDDHEKEFLSQQNHIKVA
jgi:hypothetical protein